jgi:RHH-type transcriptional regulator, rel operon repressor / antitoxin RelB
MSVVISIRLPDRLDEELNHLARETERPKPFHILQALESYVEDFSDVHIALDRLRNPNDPVISSREMRKLRS